MNTPNRVRIANDFANLVNAGSIRSAASIAHDPASIEVMKAKLITAISGNGSGRHVYRHVFAFSGNALHAWASIRWAELERAYKPR